MRFLPRDRLFDGAEVDVVDHILAAKSPSLSRLRKHMVVILKATRLCNLRCTYCHSWRTGPNNIMPLDVLARVTKDVLSDVGVSAVDFVWHGGEVTLLPLRYLEQALWIQQQCGHPAIEIANSIQTNATLLTREWISFLKKYRFSVGVSIDGPPEAHDRRRLTTRGLGTSQTVITSLGMLRDAGVSFGALGVIDECTLKRGPRAYLDYLVSIGISEVAILNALPGNQPTAGGQSWFEWSRFVTFLRELLTVWWHDYRTDINIRELASLLDAVSGGSTGLCIFNENCMGGYLTVEPDGDVSACDKYVGDAAFIFGNIRRLPLGEMLNRSERLQQAKGSVDVAKALTSGCPNYWICKGGCPHDIRLRMIHGGEVHIECCGLSDLIQDMRDLLKIKEAIRGLHA